MRSPVFPARIAEHDRSGALESSMGRGRLYRRRSIALITPCFYNGRAHGPAPNSDRGPEGREVRQTHARPDGGHEPGRRLPPSLDHDLFPPGHSVQKGREAGSGIFRIDFPHGAPPEQYVHNKCTLDAPATQASRHLRLVTLRDKEERTTQEVCVVGARGLEPRTSSVSRKRAAWDGRTVLSKLDFGWDLCV
jgi:hypothetical protein